MPTVTTGAPSPGIGTVRLDARSVDQVWVPAGSFVMGSTDTAGLEIPEWAEATWRSEQPAHEVKITHGFWIDRYEVTNESFSGFVEDGGYTTTEYWSESGLEWLNRQVADALPVDCVWTEPGQPRACVSWFEAEAYASWRGGRLPTEAEWEFAARGPESSVFPWGNEWDPSLANVVDSDGAEPVGFYPVGASWVGALDMSGNLMEWVSDWWSSSYYEQAQPIDPVGPDNGSRKVEKGGWWGADAFVARAAYRHFEDPPYYQDHHIGFRVLSEVAG